MNMKRFLCAALLAAIVLSCCGCSLGKKVEVTFQSNNGDPLVTVQVKQGGLIENAPTPTKRACDFVGWYNGDTAWDLATMKVEEPITLTAKWTLAEDAFLRDPNAGVRAEGTDIRVCTFNALISNYGPGFPIEGRNTSLRSMVDAYQPDVIAFQEFEVGWYLGYASAFADSNYVLVNADNHVNGKYNVNCSIAYRTDKLKLIRQSCMSYLSSDNRSARCAVWAQFETLDESKQQFWVVSTHWSTAQNYRDDQALELANIVNGLVKRYNLPVIVVGDLNAYEEDGDQFALSGYKSAACYRTLLQEGSLSDAKYTAAKRGLVCETHHRGDGTGTRDDVNSGFWKLGIISFRDHLINTYVSIDHILYTKGVEPLYYDTIIDEEVLNTSDHNPVYTDFKFTSQS